ncbi:hypothetical protein ADIMK_4131 [Marinobacterium lacunae]|uniref:Uncharacterized protein n=1 Tax=Marinobacterium lacunae TaxID=1232683 RepID=A0A081FT19_9GAMM|nr:hypothetical protein [Marinobacterium lacunae]KEA61674.1 hypothetical protein ADIMK_4131 [Marinobacterium lacunae]MBR9882797.1 hypothetical protein [Oceanospirillales bacterium]
MSLRLTGFALPLALVLHTHAADLAGERQIYLIDGQGKEQAIGTLTVEADGSGYGYTLDLDLNQFKDHFLSMKEMKCLEGPELWCYVPYPYDTPRRITADDLRWLEHDLLFLFKKPDTFGARLWNGIYYPLEVSDEGTIRGEAHALDLNLIASPPEDLTTPPIGQYDIGDFKLEGRWLPDIEIR